MTVRRHVADGCDKGGCCWGKDGVLAPCEIDVADERRRERAEHDAVGEFLRDHPVDADRRAERIGDIASQGLFLGGSKIVNS